MQLTRRIVHIKTKTTSEKKKKTETKTKATYLTCKDRNKTKAGRETY